MLLILLTFFLLQPASQPAELPDAPPTTHPTTQPAKRVVEYELPPASEFSRLINPIAKCYSVSVPAKSFEELRAIRYSPDGQMDRSAVPSAPTTAPSTARYTVLLPARYGDGKKPFGLIVWIAPEEGVESRQDWRPVMDAHEIIFMAPHGVPNESHSVWRIFMAMEAVKQAKAHFNIDPDRIYIAGLSGGGRIGSHTIVFFPDVFNGAFCMVGSNFYRNVPAGGKNQIYPGFWPNPVMNVIARGRVNSRIVLLTGTKDFNQPSTKAAYQAFVEDQWKYVTYLEVPEMGHQRPNAEWFEQGIAALDAPLAELAQTQYEQALQLEKHHKLGEACLAFESTARHGNAEATVADARKRAEAIRKTVNDRMLAIRQLIDQKKLDQAGSSARQLKSDFGPLVANEVDALLDEIRQARKLK